MMNPLFDRKIFIPDGEAHTMPDGRLYVYGSMDVCGESSYCSDRYHVLSTDDPRLENWTDHGVSFRMDEEHMGGLYRPGLALYAPDALYKNNKYYLYYCTSGGGEGVAESDSPAGPFGSARPIAGADGTGIDPAVFVDDDGSVYYFWGQFHLCGGRLKDDLCTLDESTVCTEILSEEEHGFHEGSSLRKRNGKYYLVYTSSERGNARCLAYAMADRPLGPYHKCGVIVDNTGCDPSSWNDHGSIECYKGQWYVFYHRSSQNTIFNRRMCAEPIFFDEEGRIAEVKMSTGGAAGAPDACGCFDGGRASSVGGGYIVPDDGGVEKLTGFPLQPGWPAWARFGPLHFAGGSLTASICVRGKGTVTLTAPGAKELCRWSVDAPEFVTLTAPVDTQAGDAPVWVRFFGEKFELRSLEFSENTEQKS